MKRLIIGLAALSMMAPAAAMAQGYQGHATFQKVDKVIIKKKVIHDNHHRHHWARGAELPRQYRGDVVIYKNYHLRRPDHNRVWVRADGQFLLINKNTGRIIETATPQ